nr:hypothetical protein [Tanacetum cinerariifolium]
MADLAFTPQHNMIDYIERTESNAEFHQIVDFLTSSSIHQSLAIHVIVDSKMVVITESSMRRDFLFTNANGITCLTNEQIFENILLMGFIFDGMWRNLDGSKKKFLMYLRFLQIFLKNQIPDLVEPLNDVYVTSTLTKKVSSNIIRKSEKFSRTVTPLFVTMLVQPAVVESEGLGNPPESQPTPSPAQPINESQISKSSSSPKNTQSPRQTLKGTGGGDSLVRAATTASLDAQQDSSNITKTQSKETLNEPTPQGEGLGSGPRRQETMGGAMAHIISEGGHTPEIDEGSMTLKELTNLCTTLLQKVLDLENVKTTHAKKIASLKKRITKLEQRQSLRFSGFHPFRAGASKRNSLGRRKVSKHGSKNLKSQQMFQDNVLDKDADTEMIVEDKGNGEKGGSIAETVSTARPDISAGSPEKAKEKGIAFKDADDSARPIRSITILQPLPTIDLKDKGKGILQESKPVKKTKKKDQDQIERDAGVALKIQAHLNKEAKIERERQEEAFKAALAEMYDEKLYIKEQKWVDAFVPIGSKEDKKRIGSRKKRAGSSLKHKSLKKQKMNDQDSKDSDKEHRKCLKVVPNDDKAIDYETLDVKSLIVNFKMLEVLNRQDVLNLHKIIMERFPANDPEGYDLILWGDLKTLVKSKKRYPLTKEILEKMISSRLEAKTKSTLALNLIKSIKLQIEEKSEFSLVIDFACGKLVFPEYMDDDIPPFLRRVFLDKAKNLENKASLGKAAKGKAAKGKAAKDDQNRFTHDDEPEAKQDGSGASDRASAGAKFEETRSTREVVLDKEFDLWKSRYVELESYYKNLEASVEIARKNSSGLSFLTPNAKATSVCDDIDEADAAADDNAKATRVHDDVGVPDVVADDNAKATSVYDDIDEADAAAEDNAKAMSVCDDIDEADAAANDNAKFTSVCDDINKADAAADDNAKDVFQPRASKRMKKETLLSDCPPVIGNSLKEIPIARWEEAWVSKPVLKHDVPFICELWVPTTKSALNLEKAECSNCMFLVEKIKTLEMKIKLLEAILEMERHPEKARTTHEKNKGWPIIEREMRGFLVRESLMCVIDKMNNQALSMAGKRLICHIKSLSYPCSEILPPCDVVTFEMACSHFSRSRKHTSELRKLRCRSFSYHDVFD